MSKKNESELLHIEGKPANVKARLIVEITDTAILMSHCNDQDPEISMTWDPVSEKQAAAMLPFVKSTYLNVKNGIGFLLSISKEIS